MSFFVSPTDSITLLCVCPSSILPIIQQALESGKSHYSGIKKKLNKTLQWFANETAKIRRFSEITISELISVFLNLTLRMLIFPWSILFLIPATLQTTAIYVNFQQTNLEIFLKPYAILHSDSAAFVDTNVVVLYLHLTSK